MKEKLTILLPLAAALAVLLWFVRWWRIHHAPPETAAPEEESAPRWGRWDWICMLGITAVYALVAFVGLGSLKGPESFLHYEQANYYALIELAEPVEIGAVRYYSGLNTGDYRLDFSIDGETWIQQLRDDGSSGMTQSYTQLLRWNDAELNEYNGYTKYIRITSGAELYLGEVAVYDALGEPVPVENILPAPGCEALFDEQDTVPEAPSYLNGSYFDEIYHARTAYEHIQQIWPYEITHPPLGKVIMTLGIRLFGMNTFGWRFMGTLMGVLMLPALYFFLKKLFGAAAVAACGTLVFAFDFMHYSQTRIATIDSYVVLFILLMYLFLYLWLTAPEGRKKTLWLGLTGLSFGLGVASKWTGLYAGAGLALIWLAYWIRRFVRQREGFWGVFGKNVAWCCLFFLVIPGLIYYFSYASYAPSQGVENLLSKDYLKIVIDNQKYMWNYHSGLVAEHPYSSNWYQWLFDARPILYYLEYFSDGTKSAIASFNNPLLSWGGLLAVGAMLIMAARERDKKALFIAAGYFINLLPWVPVSRLTFAYHYFPCTVFLTLALAWIFNDLRRRDRHWKAAVGGFTGACVALFVLFYPVLSGLRCSQDYSGYVLRWFNGSWPF